jgi:hypothetical protein
VKRSRPNWRDPADYPDPADASLHSWAWEFLRRNPQFVADLAGIREGTSPEGRALLRRWGIARVNLPDWPADSPVHFDVGPRPVRPVKIAGAWFAATLNRDDRIALEFDLAAPIEPQLERARQALIANQRHRFPTLRRLRNQAEKFPAYLRALDALDAGATRREMLEQFAHEFPDLDERGLAYWIRRARALRDGEYRALVAH